MFNTFKNKPPKELIALTKRAGDNNREIALEAQAELAKAFTLPLNDALLNEDIVSGIFTPIDLTNGEELDYPTDILNPGDERMFTAYVSAGYGKIPERQVEADYIHLRTYMVDNSIDTLLKILRDANWDIMGRMLEIFQNGFVQKRNTDAWRTVIASAASRNIQIYDGAGTNGVFSRRLISLVGLEMRRRGGKFSSMGHRKVTHMFLSPEGVEDIRNWDINQVDDLTRRELFLTEVGQIPSVAGVRLVALDELGVGAELQDYYVQTLGQAIGNSKLEIGVAVDMTKNSFIMPVRETLTVNNDENLHRAHKAGFYGWYEGGYAALDSRDSMIFAF